jgi:DNA-binding PadR family transcriptional regulator
VNNQERESIRELGEQIRTEKHMRFHRRNWLRHNAMVPKGFLRHQVLATLKEKAMSGSELMEEIQKNTGGNWKPSCGSIYPLLAWLQDNQYIKELPHENGLKRYELTQSGKELLDEEIVAREKFPDSMGFMAYSFFDRSHGKIPQEKSLQIRMTMKRLLTASIKVGKTLRENYSEKDLDEALKILNESAEKLEQINNKLKGDKA